MYDSSGNVEKIGTSRKLSGLGIRRHAYLEGEGDRLLEYWRRVHEEFFTEELKIIHQEFDTKMELVCEEFEVVRYNKE